MQMKSTSNGTDAIAAALLTTVNETAKEMTPRERAVFIAGVNLGLQASAGCMQAALLAIKNAQLPVIHQPATVREN